MPSVFVEGLSGSAREEMISLLNARLKDAISLTLAVKQAHWNVKGPGFIAVHEMLDEVADRLRESADTLAERAIVLGGTAVGTAEAVAQQSNLAPYPDDITEVQDHVAALTSRFIEFGEKVRSAIDAAAEAGDATTADVFTEVSRATDKDAWFIGANAAA